MKTAAESGPKWSERTSSAGELYLAGAEKTGKDQAALAIAAIPRMKAALLQAIDSGRVAKNLQKSGKQGWLAGIKDKGKDRFASGVTLPSAQAEYVAGSARFDTARLASANMPTGDKGSQTNINKVGVIVAALRKVKLGL